jgi:dihydroorotase
MRRRDFVCALAGAAAAAQERPFDILIRNGEVRDPARKFRQKADVGIRGGQIAAIEERIAPERGLDVIDATGQYVVPGLIDLHTHCYWGATTIGIQADPIAARTGVTTWVDAGTAGYAQVPGFRRFIVEPAQARIYQFVYFYMDNRNPDMDPVKYVRSQMKPTALAVQRNSDIILGVKIQVGSNMVGKYSPEFFRIARELCDQFQLKMMAHVSFAPPSTDEVMEAMKPGDIVTHCYNTHSIGILDDQGKVRPSVLDARRRGVLFDVGHGNGSFNFEIARKAIDQGFVADTISTDIYTLNVNGPVYDMPTTMMKLMAAGMSFDDVLERVTIAPAKVVNRVERLGTLAVGAPADVAVLALEEGDFGLVDSQKNVKRVKQRIAARATICRGKRLRA